MKIRYFTKEILAKKSIARALLQAELFEFFKKNGWLVGDFKVLEIGSEPAAHHRVFPAGWKIKHSNYEQMPGAELVIDAENDFPVKDGEFDGIVCFNTLYVIKNYENCIAEMIRVSNNFVIFNAPLISAIVSHPNDFTRLTEDRLKDMLGGLERSGKIKEYKLLSVGGSYSAAASLIDPCLKFRFVRLLVGLPAVLLDSLDRIAKRRCPIMYVVLIKK